MGVSFYIHVRALLSKIALLLVAILFGEVTLSFQILNCFVICPQSCQQKKVKWKKWITQLDANDVPVTGNYNDATSDYYTLSESDTSNQDDDGFGVNHRRHNLFMQLALKQAKLASLQDEVPIGAVVVQQLNSTTYRILSQQHNQVEQLNDASAHAEILALRDAATVLNNWRLSSNQPCRAIAHNTTIQPNTGSNKITDDSKINENIWLYCTMEPCVMCLSAIQLFRVNHIVYGTPDHRLGAIESYLKLLDKNNTVHPFHEITSFQAISNYALREECSLILKKFFRNRRQQQKLKNIVAKRMQNGTSRYDLFDNVLCDNIISIESISKSSNYGGPDHEDIPIDVTNPNINWKRRIKSPLKFLQKRALQLVAYVRKMITLMVVWMLK
jgi:tRNA(adenine34) deaminase